MIAVHEEYLVDAAGNPKAVVLPLAVWREIKAERNYSEVIRINSGHRPS